MGAWTKQKRKPRKPRTIDHAVEGVWRKRRVEDGIEFDQTARPPSHVLEYLGHVYTAKQFVEKFCPEWKQANVLNKRKMGYTPAELIVRYNALHKPVHTPDVPYVWDDLSDGRIGFTKGMKRIKGCRERRELGDTLKRTPLLG